MKTHREAEHTTQIDGREEKHEIDGEEIAHTADPRRPNGNRHEQVAEWEGN